MTIAKRAKHCIRASSCVITPYHVSGSGGGGGGGGGGGSRMRDQSFEKSIERDAQSRVQGTGRPVRARKALARHAKGLTGIASSVYIGVPLVAMDHISTSERTKK